MPSVASNSNDLSVGVDARAIESVSSVVAGALPSELTSSAVVGALPSESASPGVGVGESISSSVDVDARPNNPIHNELDMRDIQSIDHLKQLLEANEARKITDKINMNQASGFVERGGNGIVKCVKLADESKVAVKVMNYLEQRRAEYENHKDLNHPFIVKYYGYHHDDGRNLLFVFTEYCEKRSLADKEFQISELQIPELFAEICLAISYLHNKNIFHRDIKPHNILLTRMNVIKIADFGTTKQLDIEKSSAYTYTGTQWYMAPEMLEDNTSSGSRRTCSNSYGNKVDVWSLGCVLRFLVDREPPFLSLDHIPTGQYNPLPNVSHVTNELRDLLTKMLSIDPEARPNIDDVLNHSYVVPFVVDIKERFPQLEGHSHESSDMVEYVPAIVIHNENSAIENWERMKPVQTYADGRISVIDLSKYPQDDANFSWIFELWSKMVNGEFNQNMSLFLPPVRLPSDGDFGGHLLHIRLIRRYSKERPSRDLRIHARFSPSPSVEMIPLPFKCVCILSICCAKTDVGLASREERRKPPTDVALTSRNDFSSWFIFHDFRWNTLDPKKPPTLRLSFSVIQT